MYNHQRDPPFPWIGLLTTTEDRITLLMRSSVVVVSNDFFDTTKRSMLWFAA